MQRIFSLINFIKIISFYFVKYLGKTFLSFKSYDYVLFIDFFKILILHLFIYFIIKNVFVKSIHTPKFLPKKSLFFILKIFTIVSNVLLLKKNILNLNGNYVFLKKFDLIQELFKNNTIFKGMVSIYFLPVTQKHWFFPYLIQNMY